MGNSCFPGITAQLGLFRSPLVVLRHCEELSREVMKIRLNRLIDLPTHVHAQPGHQLLLRPHPVRSKIWLSLWDLVFERLEMVVRHP